MGRGSNPHRGESLALTCRIVGSCSGSVRRIHWLFPTSMSVVILWSPRCIGEDPICHIDIAHTVNSVWIVRVAIWVVTLGQSAIG